MATLTTRPPVTTGTVPSLSVNESAVRLFLAGWLSKLKYTGLEDGHLYYSIASETDTGRCYTIDYDTAAQTLRCSCPAGHYRLPCKHVRLLQLSKGWTGEAAAS